VFIHEEYEVLETCVEMWFEVELKHNWVMVAVNVSVDTVQTLEHVPDETGECLWEWYT
jgi:hypothetical protein